MAPDILDQSILELVNANCTHLEEAILADVVFYHGGIYPEYFRAFRNFIEEVKQKSKRKEDAIAVVLRTAGGSAETTERMVGVLRHHYKEVFFIVPDIAYSAGTIFCLSGDKIFMDYASTLGPVDPQVPLPTESQGYVPAMGYLDKVEEITGKGQLAEADVVLLKSLDLGQLALYEQARDLSIDLLKDWLVKYKFRNWTEHRTNENKKGQPVTDQEKEERAEQIATELANHKKWKSHGRSLNVEKLTSLRIEIDDYSQKDSLSHAIRAYNDRLTGYIDRLNYRFYLHSRHVPTSGSQ